MSYTTRQVQNLLTKPELELFQASRIGAIKAFNARQLVGKISRARALRDKYRDLYQRQTVRTATAPVTTATTIAATTPAPSWTKALSLTWMPTSPAV